jgi:hypothetical protein
VALVFFRGPDCAPYGLQATGYERGALLHDAELIGGEDFQLILAKWACFGMMMDAESLKQCEG